MNLGRDKSRAGQIPVSSIAVGGNTVGAGIWFESDSPRWRAAEPERQSIVEYERRFRGTPHPLQRGAIDRVPRLPRG
jgi:hypothetical protein